MQSGWIEVHSYRMHCTHCGVTHTHTHIDVSVIIFFFHSIFQSLTSSHCIVTMVDRHVTIKTVPTRIHAARVA